MIQANFQNNKNEGTVNGVRTKNKRIDSNSDKKGPMKACYNPQQDKWALKYSYQSKPTSANRRIDKNNFDSSSDYGTMSRPDADEDNFPQFQEVVPNLNLNNGLNSNKMNTFNDISIALRRERIGNILSDIMSVPRLVDSNLSRRSLSRSSSVRRHVSNDRMSDAGSPSVASVANSRLSKRSHGTSSSLRRSVSSPKLDFIPEIKAPSRKKRENKPGSLGKIPEMPPVKQPIRKLSKKPRVPALNLNTTDELSVEHLPHRDELLTKLVPTIGDDTKNELAISAPTLGDDTHNDLVMSSLTLEDDTLMEPFGDETDTFIEDDVPVDYVRQNIRKAVNHSKGTDSGRSTASTMISTKHKTGSVPKYLKTRQAKWRDAEAAALAAIPDPDCPPGHRLLSQEDRLEGLEARRERHKEVIMQVNRLPVSSDTRRVRMRREELEAELGTLDAEITVYTRNKVFVNINADGEKGENIEVPQYYQRGQSGLSVDWPL